MPTKRPLDNLAFVLLRTFSCAARIVTLVYASVAVYAKCARLWLWEKPNCINHFRKSKDSEIGRTAIYIDEERNVLLDNNIELMKLRRKKNAS